MIAVALLSGLLHRQVQTEQHINPLIQRCKKHNDFWAQNIPQGSGGDRGAYYSVRNSAELSRLLTAQSLQDLQLDNASNRGDVWKCLAAGVYCLRAAMIRLDRLSGQPREDLRKVLFADLINDLIREGGAAQANAAFAGALLGAYLGYDAIPVAWRRGLSHRSFLMRKCKLLCTNVGVIQGVDTRSPTPSCTLHGPRANGGLCRGLYRIRGGSESRCCKGDGMIRISPMLDGGLFTAHSNFQLGEIEISVIGFFLGIGFMRLLTRRLLESLATFRHFCP